MADGTRTLVVFDVDGTLTDSRPSIYASYRHAALNAGLPIPSDDMLAHHLCGGLPDNVRELFGVEGDAASEVIGLYRRYYSEECVGKVPLFDGMEEVLRDLRSEGYLLSVATMKIEDVATEFIRGLGLEDLFLTVAGADASGTVTKADMVRRCAREADADIVVMIGDCPQDLEGARQAGAEFIAAAYGYGLPPGKCKEEGIPYVLSPRDIPAEVGRMKSRILESGFSFWHY